MSERKFNVLFLCTHNSARSVMAEALLNVLGRENFHAFSAGSMPSGRVNPFALEKAAAIGFDTSAVRSKSWDEFAAPGAPHMDIVITVCDNAAAEACPLWPVRDGIAPALAHWGFPDPSNAVGDDAAKRRAFDQVFQLIRQHVEALINLPPEVLVRSATRAALVAALGKIHAA